MPPQRLHPNAAGLMRSLLFVPADSPAKLAKALSCGADALILDLEDSVAPARKEAARAGAASFLAQTASLPARPRLIVRVNALSTGATDADLDAVVPARPDAVMLPKAEGAASIVHLDAKLTAREVLGGVGEGTILIVPLATETARSLFVTGSYRDASPRLAAITWGAEDLATDLGAEANRDGQGQFLDPYRLARTLCIAGAANAGVPAIDTVYVDFRNDAGLRRECEEARRDGFTGKLAIHPSQVATINEVFTPGPEAVARAQAVVAAFAASPEAGVVGIGGVMYDRPHLTKAQRLLARAKAAGQSNP
jgi:citrate lyase subunit beta / citryl-CoA lyase